MKCKTAMHGVKPTQATASKSLKWQGQQGSNPRPAVLETYGVCFEINGLTVKKCLNRP